MNENKQQLHLHAMSCHVISCHTLNREILVSCRPISFCLFASSSRKADKYVPNMNQLFLSSVALLADLNSVNTLAGLRINRGYLNNYVLLPAPAPTVCPFRTPRHHCLYLCERGVLHRLICSAKSAHINLTTRYGVVSFTHFKTLSGRPKRLTP
jgi:hypothetical protein